MTATLSLTVAAKDNHGREAGLPAPLGASWTPIQPVWQTVTLNPAATTALTVPDDATLLVLDLQAAYDLVLKGGASDDGIPLAANSLGLPVVLPLGTDAEVRVANERDTDQEIRAYFL